MKIRTIKSNYTTDAGRFIRPLEGDRLRPRHRITDADPTIGIQEGFQRLSNTGREYAGDLGGSKPTRDDGATRAVLAAWTQNWDVEIVEEAGTKYLIAWVPLQGSEGGPQSMSTELPVTKSAVVGDTVQRKPVAQSNVHDVKMTRQAKQAINTIAKNTSTMRSINEANAKFYGAK